MDRAMRFQFILYFQSAGANQERWLRKGGPTDCFGTALSRNTHIFKRQEDIYNAPKRELDAFEHDVLQQKYENPTYTLYFEAEHDPFCTIEMVCTKIK